MPRKTQATGATASAATSVSTPVASISRGSRARATSQPGTPPRTQARSQAKPLAPAQTRTQTRTQARVIQPPNGTVRSCQPHRGEVARHRVITAEGRDVMVTTAGEADEFVTGAYPVEQGYLVMAYQPLHEVRSAGLDIALAQHEQVVRALATAGLRVVRARRRMEAREQAERREAAEKAAAESALGVPTASGSLEVERAEAPLGATA